jgi:hypothetical protein
MAAEDNLSHELFFNVHRGIAAIPKEVDQRRRVGMHWSADKEVAVDFAVDNTERGVTKPIVFHGQVPMSSVETDLDALHTHNVGGDFSGEKEVPVSLGKKVLITGRTTFRPTTESPFKNISPETRLKERHRYPKSRTRTYNPPREATA